MIQIQAHENDAPHNGEAFNGVLASAPVERVATASTPTALSLAPDGEPTWPSECERLALINVQPGGLPSIGEQYLLEAFYMVPRGGSRAR